MIMSQTDDIHESFYDLFNQHFRRFDDPKRGPRYFTNIAIGAHTKPSRVDQEFQCIVVIKESEIENTPAPFLNRFEKYFLLHTNLLQLVLNALPPCLKLMVNSAKEKVIGNGQNLCFFASYSTIVLYSRDNQGWWAWSTKKSTLAHLQESFMAT